MAVSEKRSPAHARILAAVKAGAKTRVRVGVIGGKAAAAHPGEDGLTTGEIAVKNELGLGVPERSFVRAFVDQHRAQILEEQRTVARRVLQGKLEIELAAPLLGARYAGAMQQFIADNKVQPPSSDYTNKLKGSTVTLIDSGQLRSAITYEVF